MKIDKKWIAELGKQVGVATVTSIVGYYAAKKIVEMIDKIEKGIKEKGTLEKVFNGEGGK